MTCRESNASGSPLPGHWSRTRAFLIFDEATSALDHESEAVIQQNLAQISQGRTVFMIAHRLSTVRQAHCIYVIDKGEIIEQGTHDELLQTSGFYATLHAHQAARERAHVRRERRMAFGTIGRHWMVWKAAWQAESGRPLGNATLGARATEFLPAVLRSNRRLLTDRTRLALDHLGCVHCGCPLGDARKNRHRCDGEGAGHSSGYSKVIQPYEAGVIAAIRVQDGQPVKQGDVLIELVRR
ncbi:MAG: biotin/lipoyl-binding protein [Nitrospira sp.]|nr:biotin/lipoyl-binding protein [Nitrospira sp.]